MITLLLVFKSILFLFFKNPDNCSYSTVVGLKADLCKLNIYMHVMAFLNFTLTHLMQMRCLEALWFVCQLNLATGRELIMHHHKQEIRSSSAGTSLSTLHWAAFFSDVEHEVLPVGEGYRDTLTYNLSYHSKPSSPTFNVKTSSFYKLL